MLIGTDHVDLVYAVQPRNIATRLEAGPRAVGREIGMTLFALEKQLGYDQPEGTSSEDSKVPDAERAPASEPLREETRQHDTLRGSVQAGRWVHLPAVVGSPRIWCAWAASHPPLCESPSAGG
jgi:hypothetical protein